MKTTTVEWVTPDSPAAQAGFQPGDVITQLRRSEQPGWEQVYEHAKLNANQTVPVTVERGGALDRPELPRTRQRPRDDDFDITRCRHSAAVSAGPHQRGRGAAGNAGRRGRPARRRCNRVRRRSSRSIPDFAAGLHAVGTGQAADSRGAAQRRHAHMVGHPAKLDPTGSWALLAVPPPYRDDPLPLAGAVSKSLGFCKDNSLLIVEVLQRLFTHKVSVTQLTGRWALRAWPAKRRR